MSPCVCAYGSVFVICFFFKQKTAYEMRISDWSSDVCSSDLCAAPRPDSARGWNRSWSPTCCCIRAAHSTSCSRRSRSGRTAPTSPNRTSVVSGKSVSVTVDLGGRRILKQNTNIQQQQDTCEYSED